MDALNGTSFPLIAAGSASLAGDIWRSWDGGYTWEKVGFSNQIVSDISYGNSRYVMVGVTGYPLFSTNYGDSWSFSTDTNICNCHGACCYAGEDIAFGLSIFVVARNGQAYPVNGLLTTGDGVTWTNRIALAGLPLSTIAFGNDTFVVAGRSGIYRSEISAPILTARLLSSSNAVDLLISGEFGRSYRLQTSTNFSSWDDVMSFTNQGPPYEFVDPIQPNFSARFYRVFSP